MVKRSRDQSQEAPSRLSWWMMVAAGFGLPRPHLLEELLAAESPGDWAPDAPCSWRSTTIWVAMPAWSVPGCHSTSRPRMRSKRHQHVLQRVVERMAHVQAAGDVGRRDDDAIGRARRAAPAGRNGMHPPAPRPHRCALRPPAADRSFRSSGRHLFAAIGCAVASARPMPSLSDGRGSWRPSGRIKREVTCG